MKTPPEVKLAPKSSKLEPISPQVLLWAKFTFLVGTTALALSFVVWAWQTGQLLYILLSLVVLAVNVWALKRSKHIFKRALGLEKKK